MKRLLALCSVCCAGMVASGSQEYRTRYALNFGDDTTPIAQFVPGNAYIADGVSGNNLTWYNDSDANHSLANVKDDMMPYLDVYRKIRYGQDKSIVGGGLKIKVDSLSPDIEYKVRLHSVEFWYSSANQRLFAFYVNGERKSATADGIFDPCKDSGAKHTPIYYDVTNCFAATDGTMTLFCSNVVDKLALCGVEVFEPVDAPCYRPTPAVKGFAEFAYINLETKGHRSSSVVYDIDYRDGGEDAPVKRLYSGVRGNAVYDVTEPASGLTRSYRVRMSSEGNELWSDWISDGRMQSALTDNVGKTLLPVSPEAYNSTGVVSVFRSKASDDDATAMNEVAVTETITKSRLEWTQNDVPTSCTGDDAPVRILTSGKIFFPALGNGCKVVVRGTGLVNVWFDNSWMRASLLSEGETEAAFDYVKIKGDITKSATTNDCEAVAGLYDFYVEQLQTAGKDINTSIAFIDAEGKEIPYRLYPSEFTADISPWNYHQLHMRTYHYLSDSYVLPLNEDRTAFRIFGSGVDTWGGLDGGSILYQQMKGAFEISMRINSIGDVYSGNGRFGFGFRGGIGTTAADKFLMLAGYNPRGGVRPMVFVDDDLSNGLNIVSVCSGAEGEYKNYPIWLKFKSVPGMDADKKRVFNYEFSFSTDGETWKLRKSGSVPRTSSVCVGPIVVASTSIGTVTPWMDIDNLELIDQTVRPLAIIIR